MRAREMMLMMMVRIYIFGEDVSHLGVSHKMSRNADADDDDATDAADDFLSALIPI